MKFKIFVLVGLFCFAPFTATQINAQSLTTIAKKAKANAEEKKRVEQERYENIIDSRDISEYEQFLQDYPKSKHASEIKGRITEINLWDNTQSADTKTAYQNYLNKSQLHWYDDQANAKIASIKKAEEKQAWDKVCQVGTISAYQQYLEANPSSSYKHEAENAILALQSANDWEAIKYSSDKSAIQNFIDKYPNAKETPDATLMLHELKGKEYYESGNIASAYNEFSNFSSRDKVRAAYRNAYDTSMEYHEYSQLNENSGESVLQSFLRNHPSSIYSSDVKNYIAISKAKSFTDYATQTDYDNALNYATDQGTKTRVENYIQANKDEQNERRRRIKAWEREQNGGTFNFGIEFCDLGWNGEADTEDALYYYNVGLALRIGNFNDRVQFALGIKPGVLMYQFDDETDAEVKFHMPVYGQLKLNLFKLSSSSRFFISGLFQYNAVREETMETKMSWSAGLGFAWKHIDWLFYYRQDLGNIEDSFESIKGQHFFGTSLVYYFKI